jgi:tetratricopeptide (TPR) repeat protein
MGMVLDRQSSLVVGSGGPEYARLGAHMLIIGGQMRLSNIDAEALERARDAFRRDADLALMQVRKEVRPASFSDVLSGALVFPVRAASEAEAARGVREQVQQYFANTWPQLPRKSLGGAKPVDAVGDPQLRKKLAGIVQFLEDCANIGGRKSGYDFGELRQHLGIGRSGSGGGDVAAMETAELATLQTDGLSDEQLEQAFQAAQRQDARDLAERFARALVARPPRPDRPDRYPWFAHLITQALGAGATDAALDHVNEGEKFDCEHNEGRRRNDYELRRAQVHAKRGEAEQAADVFERLIQRAPGELRYRAQAAEALLGARQGARALQFAEGGLAQAREKQDRDSEQHFQELVAAAKKQVGG